MLKSVWFDRQCLHLWNLICRELSLIWRAWMNGFWNPSRETFSRAVHQSWQKSMNVLGERTIQKIPWCWGEEKAESKDVLIQIHGHFYMTRLYHFRGDTSSLLAQGTGVSIPCLYQASLCIPTYSQVCWGYHPSIDHQIEFVEFFPSIKKKKVPLQSFDSSMFRE